MHITLYYDRFPQKILANHIGHSCRSVRWLHILHQLGMRRRLPDQIKPGKDDAIWDADGWITLQYY